MIARLCPERASAFAVIRVGAPKPGPNAKERQLVEVEKHFNYAAASSVGLEKRFLIWLTGKTIKSR
jgi:hypothetical protein